MDLAEILTRWVNNQPDRKRLIDVDQALAIGALAVQSEIEQHDSGEKPIGRPQECTVTDWRRAFRVLLLLQRAVTRDRDG